MMEEQAVETPIKYIVGRVAGTSDLFIGTQSALSSQASRAELSVILCCENSFAFLLNRPPPWLKLPTSLKLRRTNRRTNRRGACALAIPQCCQSSWENS